MRLSQETIDQVRHSVDLPDLIKSCGTRLRRQSRQHVGWCPFCVKPRTPAFAVYHDRWYCFRCHSTGSAIDWMMATQGMRFTEAVEYLADRAGISVHACKPATRLQRNQDAEDSACAEWWWQERRNEVRAQLDCLVDAEPPAIAITWTDDGVCAVTPAPVSDDYATATCLGRILRWMEGLTVVEKMQVFREKVRTEDRERWRLEGDFAAAWMGLAKGGA